MRAIVQTDTERGSVALEERERPTPADDEVLVRVHSAGLCGSDAHAYKYVPGYEWIQIPRVMGHEYSGTVAAVGDAVTEFEPGDKVVEEPIHDCGRCFQCKNGQSNVCQNFTITGLHNDGAYADYTVVGERHLHRVPDEVRLDHAAITEPTSIAARAVLEQSRAAAGETVLVIGPGPIGTLTATIADSIGANVLVSGLDRDADNRLPLLEGMGIETVNAEREELAERRDELTVGGGFDVIFDATGHHTGVETAAEHVRRGGQIVVVGLPAEDSELFMTPLVRGEVDLNTSYGSTWRNFEQALRLMENGTIDPEAITDSYPIDDPVTAFEDFLEAKSCKPVFRFDDE